MSKIAVLSWGSILSDPRNLRVTQEGFIKSDLMLPLEFCRISSDKRLTICLSEEYGRLNNVFCATSAFQTLREAINNFGERENVDLEKIGIVEVSNNRWRNSEAYQKFPKSCEYIFQWLIENNFDAAIFSALGRRFKDVIHVPFSVENAYNYVNNLRDVDSKKKAFSYLVNVPNNIKTPFRDYFTYNTLREIILNS
jgi:hypothetical protein